MSNVLTHIQVRVDCPYPVQFITDLKITSRFNEHSRIFIKGVLREEDQDRCIKTSTANDPIRVYETGEDGRDRLIFSGVVTLLNVRHEYGIYYVEIEGMSYSYLLDIESKSRSFQDINASYSKVISQIVSGYKDADCILVPKDRPTNALIVQYNETDWTFLKRMASHFNTVLVPQTLGNGPRFWVGIQQAVNREFGYMTDFTARTDMNTYLHLCGHGFDVQETDFTKYEVGSVRRFILGDRVAFQGRSCIVEQAVESFEDGLFQ